MKTLPHCWHVKGLEVAMETTSATLGTAPEARVAVWYCCYCAQEERVSIMGREKIPVGGKHGSHLAEVNKFIERHKPILPEPGECPGRIEVSRWALQAIAELGAGTHTVDQVRVKVQEMTRTPLHRLYYRLKHPWMRIEGP